MTCVILPHEMKYFISFHVSVVLESIKENEGAQINAACGGGGGGAAGDGGADVGTDIGVGPAALGESGATGNCIDDSPEGFNTLLLGSTRNGHSLDSSEVRTAFRRFICTFDPNLDRVSTKIIRSSYETLMFRSWKSGHLMTDKRKVNFCSTWHY